MPFISDVRDFTVCLLASVEPNVCCLIGLENDSGDLCPLYAMLILGYQQINTNRFHMIKFLDRRTPGRPPP